MLCRLMITVVIFGIFITPLHTSVYLKTVKINCTGNLKYVYGNHTCRLKAINRYKTVGIMEVHARNQLRNISFNLALFVRNSANVFKPFLINVTENMCRWYDRRSPGSYVTIIMKVLKQFTNINHSCPYTGAIIAKNLYLDMSLVPVQLPQNSYKFHVTFYEGLRNVLEQIGTVSYYMDLIETRQ